MNVKKLLKIFISIHIIMLSVFFIMVNCNIKSKSNIYLSNNSNNEIIKYNDLKKCVVVKSDGKEVAILDSSENIGELINAIRTKYMNNINLDNVESIKLNNKITYVESKVNKELIKSPQYYVSNITKGDKDTWRIGFSSKERCTSVCKVLSRGFISSQFGMRWGKMHNGIDIAAKLGTPIHAVLPGKVIYSGWQEGYGNVVELDSGNNLVIVYAHCNKLLVNKNDIINKGEKIAEVGSTGRSTGPHVHFEVRKNGKAINPENYLK